MTRPRHIQPRRGTLWKADSDAALVMKAEKGLIWLISDPFGFEALQNIRRELPHLFRKLVKQRAPVKLGALAKRLQSEPDNVPAQRKARGRPRKPEQDRAVLAHWLSLAEALVRCNGARSITAAVRLMLRKEFPRASDKALNRAVQKCAQALYEHLHYVKANKARAEHLEKARNSASRRISQVT